MKIGRKWAVTAAAALAVVWGFAGAETGKIAPAATAAAGQKVTNFRLADQNLLSHELYNLADAKAVVLITHGVGCPIVRNNTLAYNELKAKYEDQGVEFFMLNSNIQDSREDIASETEEFGLDFRVLTDTNQLVGEELNVSRTGEVIVINPKTWEIAFRGPIDDRVTYERQKAVASETYAEDALDEFLAGQPVTLAQVAAPGCIINLVNADREQHAQISYTNDIAPIIRENCVDCHQPGGIGPMELVTYEDIQGFAPMIRETIRTQRMPPYHADPRIGTFHDARQLAPQEIKTLVHWIEAGAPRGNGPDPLAAVEFQAPEWPLGEPDLILDIPEYAVPATGYVDYQNPWVANPLTEGRWLRASTIKVGERQAVHHVLTGYRDQLPSGPNTRGGGVGGISVGGYAVGAESTIAPEDAGTFLPAGGAIGFQMHYTPFGREAVDNTQIGLYFYDDEAKPTYVMRNAVIADAGITIPPNEAEHKEVAYAVFPSEALLYSIFPHAHYRGRSAIIEAEYPDGRREMLVALPKYDFNWQRGYDFEEPLLVPPGTKIIATYTYDNSVRNPANPDPNATITWGDQSFEEMLYTAIRYRWTDETSDNPVNHDQAMSASMQFGMLDDNVNGLIEQAELVGRIGQQLRPAFALLDRNGDGGIDAGEMAAMAAAGGRGGRGGGNTAEAEDADVGPQASR
jgi:peroxiredoxin/mono/diheme cytochrome c family protein